MPNTINIVIVAHSKISFLVFFHVFVVLSFFMLSH